MGFTNTPEEELRRLSREEVDGAFVIIYSRWKERGRWDEQAWGTVWEYCRSIIRAKVRCPGDANEVLSNVSRKLQELFEKRQGINEPTSYINRMISTAIADCYRRKSIRTDLSDRLLKNLVIEIQGTKFMSPSDTAAGIAETFRELHSLVVAGKVSPDDKDIFLMQYVGGCSIREIAEKSKRSRNAVAEASAGVLKQVRDSIRRKEAMCRLRHTHS